jgi:hypothetical protein
LDPQQPPHLPSPSPVHQPTTEKKKKKQKKENTHRGLGLASQQGRIYHLQENRHVLGQHAYYLHVRAEEPTWQFLVPTNLSAKFSIQREWRCTEMRRNDATR